LPKANLWLFLSVEISFVNTSALQCKGEGEANQQICERICEACQKLQAISDHAQKSMISDESVFEPIVVGIFLL